MYTLKAKDIIYTLLAVVSHVVLFTVIVTVDVMKYHM